MHGPKDSSVTREDINYVIKEHKLHDDIHVISAQPIVCYSLRDRKSKSWMDVRCYNYSWKSLHSVLPNIAKQTSNEVYENKTKSS